jgi:hypothetical protein
MIFENKRCAQQKTICVVTILNFILSYTVLKFMIVLAYTVVTSAGEGVGPKYVAGNLIRL